jgi:oxygen-independent coproporphyrinogen-3 oxidase
VAGFSATLDKVIGLAGPHRAVQLRARSALSRTQKQIEIKQLPAPDTKRYSRWPSRAGAAGYGYIGMDHFAKPGDEWPSRSERKLHRNFRVLTRPDCDLIAFGISAIGKIGPSMRKT